MIHLKPEELDAYKTKQSSSTNKAPRKVISKVTNVESDDNWESSDVTTCSADIKVLNVSSLKLVLLSTAVVQSFTPDGSSIHSRALVDQCSQSSFILESLFQKLGLKRSAANIRFSGLGDSTPTSTKDSVRFKIFSRFNKSKSFDVKIYSQSLKLQVITSISNKIELTGSSWKV